MILDIDAGNTRIKWRIIMPGQGAEPVASGHILVAPAKSFRENLLSGPGEQVMAGITRVRVSSVRGPEFREQLEATLAENWQLVPEFAVVEKQACGVTNAYSNVGSMGVDRWLAILAAYNLSEGTCGVLDFGSAITFDWVDGGGNHQGGYIVPGIQLMLESLVGKSPALAVTVDPASVPEPGASTGTAIGNGLLAMACGFADHCHQLVADTGAAWFLTGGDAGKVGPQLSWPHTVTKDLVLDGLALALP